MNYPHEAGWKQGGTSKDAALAIEPKAKTVRDRVLEMLTDHAMTPDECADAMGESILTVRPRCSELFRRGLLIDTGIRRKNSSGRPAIVWTRKRPEPVQGDLFA